MRKLLYMHRKHYPIYLFIATFLFVLTGLSACEPLHIISSITPSVSDSTGTPITKNTTPILAFSPTPTSRFAITPETLRGVQVTLWHPWRGDERVVFHSMVVEFNQSNPWGITVIPNAIPGLDQLAERVQAVWGSEQLPNLVVSYSFQAQNWQKIKPLVLDWQPFLTDSTWGIPDTELALFFPKLWEASVVNGIRWGLPARRLGQVMFYNETLAKELGFTTPPRTSEAFQKQACAAGLTDANNALQPRGGWYLSQDYPTILSWIFAFNGNVLSEDSKDYQFNSDEVKQAFTYLRKLFDQGCMVALSDIAPADALAQRRALFISGSSGDISAINKAFEQAASHDHWGAIPFPSPDGETRMTVYGLDFILLKSNEQAQLASWLFVKWMLSKEVQARLAEKMSSLPLRSDSLDILKENPNLPPAHKAVLEMIPGSIPEPSLASWNTVRWVVSDSSKQLFAWYFTPEQMPTLLKLLQDTAQSFESTPTPIPTLTPTP